jgi:ABC-2 type transport system permease protein
MTAVGFVFYLAGGAFLFGVHIQHFHLLAALTLFVLTITSFMGVGILWAGVVLLIKRGDAIRTVGGFVMVIMSGVFFPPDLFPSWMQKISRLIPLTDALEGMRLTLLRGYDLHQLSGIITRLGMFAAVLMLVGLVGFNWAVRVGKSVGSLTQY